MTDTQKDHTPKLDLLDVEYLRTRGISEDYALQEGLTSVPDYAAKVPLTQYGIGKVPCGGLLIEYRQLAAKDTYRLRLRTTTFHGTAMEGSNHCETTTTFPKFYASKGKEVVPYFPRELKLLLADTTKPLWISEGPIKAISLTCHGFPCIGLGGVEAGYHDVAEAHETGHLGLNEEMKRVDWRARTVYLVSDAGRQSNPSVARGEAKLAKILREAGANVLLVQLPWANKEPREDVLFDPADQGPDDYVARHGRDAFQALVDAAVPANPIEWAGTTRVPAEIDRLLGYLPFQAALAIGGERAQSAVHAAWGKRTTRGAIREAVEAYVARAEAKKDAPEWTEQFSLNKEGIPTGTLANILLAIRNDERLKGRLVFNEFSAALLWKEPPPWRTRPGPVTDPDVVGLTEFLQVEWKLVAKTTMVAEALNKIADENAFHPVRAYFNELKWDGTKRLDSWLPTYVGVKDSAYVRAVSAKWLIGGVARVMQPGCKMDTVLILEGGQGKFKSTVLNVLAGDEWFLDDLRDIGSKDACDQLAGHLIVEMGELAALSRADAEVTKRFLTTKVDTFREAYGRFKKARPRQNIFAGSTNQHEYLKDETGNRRFWPVAIGEIDIAALERDRDQLWAEAVHQYRAGAKWWFLPDEKDIIEQALDAQESRRQPHPWEELLATELAGVDTSSVNFVLETVLNIPKDRWTSTLRVQVGKCFTALGWQRHRGPRPSREWLYARPGWTLGPSDGDAGDAAARADWSTEDITSPSERVLGPELAPVAPERSEVEHLMSNPRPPCEGGERGLPNTCSKPDLTEPTGASNLGPQNITGTIVAQRLRGDGSYELDLEGDDALTTVVISGDQYQAMLYEARPELLN